MSLVIITDINNVDELEWYKFVYNHPFGNFFQTPEIYHIYQKLDYYDPLILVAYENEQIVGLLVSFIIKEPNKLRGYFSRRCIIEGGPLIKNNNKVIFKTLLDYFHKLLKKRAIYSEFRNFFDTSHYKELYSSCGYSYHPHLNIIVNLESGKDPFLKLSSTRRRHIKKSYSVGAEIIEANKIDQVEKFYEILTDLYKNKIKKPLPAINFFIELFNSTNVKFFLVMYGEEILGGIICPIFRSTIYEWYICGIDSKYKHIHPSVLATWAPIYYASKNNLKSFDFMGAGKPDENYGVREFKLKFGGEVVNYGRYVKINNRILYSVGEMGIKLLKKI